MSWKNATVIHQSRIARVKITLLNERLHFYTESLSNQIENLDALLYYMWKSVYLFSSDCEAFIVSISQQR